MQGKYLHFIGLSNIGAYISIAFIANDWILASSLAIFQAHDLSMVNDQHFTGIFPFDPNFILKVEHPLLEPPAQLLHSLHGIFTKERNILYQIMCQLW